MSVNSKMLERLKEYEVDFEYSKAGFYSAAKRIEQSNSKTFRRNRLFSTLSLLVSIFTFSSLAIIFTDYFGDSVVIVLGVLSLISIGIDVFHLQQSKLENAMEYRRRAEQYNDLFKKVKNVLAKVEDNNMLVVDIERELAWIESEDAKLRSFPLILDDEDHAQSKKQVSSGNYKYDNQNSDA